MFIHCAARCQKVPESNLYQERKKGVTTDQRRSKRNEKRNLNLILRSAFRSTQH